MSLSEKRDQIALKFFNTTHDNLSDVEKKVVKYFVERKNISQSIESEKEELTLGQRLADKVAEFGGSWTFIISFACVLIGWVILNSFILVNCG